MPTTPFVVGIMGLGILNGIFSPFMVYTARIILRPLAPGLLMTSPIVFAFVASLLAATATVIFAGVPAALFERVTGRKETDVVSYTVWLVTAALLAFPALSQAISLF